MSECLIRIIMVSVTMSTMSIIDSILISYVPVYPHHESRG